MACSSSCLGELRCGGIAVSEGQGGYQTLTHCVFGIFYIFCISLDVFRVICKKLFQKFTAAKLFASAHFAIAHCKDVFPENF